jgi:hypothetical protein
MKDKENLDNQTASPKTNNGFCQVKQFVRHLIPKIDRWAGKGTYRLFWLNQWICLNRNTKNWYVQFRWFKHQWQYSNLNLFKF